VVALLALLGSLKTDSVLTVSVFWVRFSLAAFAVGIATAVIALFFLWMFYDLVENFEKRRATMLFKALGHDAIYIGSEMAQSHRSAIFAAALAMLGIGMSSLAFVIGAGAALAIFGARECEATNCHVGTAAPPNSSGVARSYLPAPPRTTARTPQRP
jgi:hypothetical protein